MNDKRILGLDVGDRRIGVAVSDELGITARGLFTLERTNLKQDTQRLLELVRENECSCVVVGLPLNLSGQDSVQTEKIRAFAKKLENKFQSNAMQNVKIFLHDERFSTVLADRAFDEIGTGKQKRKALVDQQAAAIILQDYLETNRSG